jgi:FkbM family methyltransferase
MQFEKAILESNPACKIHIFDKDAFSTEKWFPNRTDRKKIFFHKAFIGNSKNATSVPPVHTLSGIMKHLGHNHIDVLKMDIEGAEWDILKGPLPSIGQLQVEIHGNSVGEKGFYKLQTVFDNVEKHGLRLFHKEANALNMQCMEFAFIQNLWQPETKFYNLTANF